MWHGSNSSGVTVNFATSNVGEQYAVGNGSQYWLRSPTHNRLQPSLMFLRRMFIRARAELQGTLLRAIFHSSIRLSSWCQFHAVISAADECVQQWLAQHWNRYTGVTRWLGPWLAQCNCKVEWKRHPIGLHTTIMPARLLSSLIVLELVMGYWQKHHFRPTTIHSSSLTVP